MNYLKPISKLSGRKIGAISSAVMLGLLASCNIQGLGGGGSVGPEVASTEGPSVNLAAPVRVALLVPNQGNDASLNAIGDSIENAAKLAVERQGQGEIELVVYHTGGSPALAGQMAAQAQAEGASLILGPLKSEEAAAVDSASSLPLMSFSNNSEIVAPNIYVLGTTLENVADRVVRYQKERGGKSLGIVYPNTLPGRLGQQASVTVAEANGIKVVANENYVLTQEDIAASGPRIAENLRSSGANMVMFTDYPAGGLGYIGMALSNNGYTNQSAQYMGLARWQDGAAQLSEAGFDGGLYTLPDPIRSAEFDTLYGAAYGSAPHSLGGLGYDGALAAIMLVRDARKTNDSTPFSSNDIEGLSIFGATGAVTFKNHLAWRGLAVMRLTNGQGVLVSQAPKDM